MRKQWRSPLPAPRPPPPNSPPPHSPPPGACTTSVPARDEQLQTGPAGAWRTRRVRDGCRRGGASPPGPTGGLAGARRGGPRAGLAPWARTRGGGRRGGVPRLGPRSGDGRRNPGRVRGGSGAAAGGAGVRGAARGGRGRRGVSGPLRRAGLGRGPPPVAAARGGRRAGGRSGRPCGPCCSRWDVQPLPGGRSGGPRGRRPGR